MAVIGATTAPWRAIRPGLVLFAFGDFAFNLFWQSVMLFLLFYYTEALRLPVETAALTFMLALIWDGVVSLAVGVFADARREERGYRRFLLIGAGPLALAFLLAYLPPPLVGMPAALLVLGGHLLFRTAYAMVNVPYLAMSARVTQDSWERALIAGMRMLFGTAALVVVTLGTAPIGRWISGSREMADVYFAGAGAFAVLGALILFWVGSSVPEIAPAPELRRPALRECFASLFANRAFLALNGAAFAMIAAATILTKSVLYYYKYLLHDEAAGQMALAAMGVIGAVTVPLWMLVRRWLGARATWFAAAGLGIAFLAGFAAIPVRDVWLMQAFLMGMQTSFMGLTIVFWAMLPDTVEYGEHSTGLRVEGTVFGVAALLQRIAIGVATALFGVTLGTIGYQANVQQPPATLEGMRLTIALLPLGFLALSIVLMAGNPLKRRTHAAVVAELTGRSPGP